MNFTEVNIRNFRGIRKSELKELGLVNLFFGKNNCGKSSLLEALFLMSGPSNPTMPIVVNNLRSLPSFAEDDIKVDFYRMDASNEIYISSKGEQEREVSIRMIESRNKQISLDQLNQMNSEHAGKRYGFKIEFSVNGDKKEHHTELIIADNDKARAISDNSYKESLYAEYIPSGYMLVNVNEKLAQVIKDKRETDIIDALRLIEPHIKDLQLLDKKIMVDIGLPSRLPINVLGDGVRKVLSVLLSIYNSENGVLMVDEIDNGLHYSIMPKLWKAILHACKKCNTQLFVSTHSIDMVKALVQSVRHGDADDISISSYKLIKKEDDELVALRYNKTDLSYTIQQEIEVR